MNKSIKKTHQKLNTHRLEHEYMTG